MLPYSVAQVKERIIERFPTKSAKFENRVEDNIEDWIRNLAETFPYWFLTVYPGHRLIPSFPYASPTALGAITPRAGNWVDAGWLVTTPGQAVYDVYHPLETDEVDNVDWWELCKIQMIDFVYEFTPSGAFNGSLPVPEFESGLLMTAFKNQTRPRMVMWRNTESKAQIIFNPTPDKQYLYVIQYVIKDPPMYEDEGVDEVGNPIVRNRFLTAAPEAVVLYGLMKHAQLNVEGGMSKSYAEELFGAAGEAFGGGNGNPPTGGLLGRLRKDTIKRRKKAREMMEQYTSVSQATGLVPGGLTNKAVIWGNRRRRYR